MQIYDFAALFITGKHNLHLCHVQHCNSNYVESTVLRASHVISKICKHFTCRPMYHIIFVSNDATT